MRGFFYLYLDMHSALSILKKYWNYDRFRPAQIPIIDSILADYDTLGLLTTGGGKSICFQVPAMMREGVCLVISPLIALMKDQIVQLNQRKIPAAAYYSAQSKEKQQKIIDYLMQGKLKFLYISPERLITKDFQTRLREIKVGLLVIDEAHCISQWGYDFRPAYLKIPNIYAYLPNTPKLALTATATPQVIEDIQDKLDFKNGKVFTSKQQARTCSKGRIMGKHHDKIKKALAQRIAASKPGEKAPGSMNKKKTGYRGVKANNAR